MSSPTAKRIVIAAKEKCKIDRFYMELVPFHYPRAVGTHEQCPFARKVHHSNAAEEVIQFWSNTSL